MIILGIDPGTTRIGYGFVEWQENVVRCLSYGILRIDGPGHVDGLTQAAEQLSELISLHRPEAAAIEKLFFSNNQKTAMRVSEMRGVLLATLARHNLAISEFTPMQVKQFVAGYGKADKKQMQNIVRLLLKIDRPITPDDAADALAIALCYAPPRRG